MYVFYLWLPHYSVMLFTVCGIVALLTFTHTLYGAKDK